MVDQTFGGLSTCRPCVQGPLQSQDVWVYSPSLLARVWVVEAVGRIPRTFLFSRVRSRKNVDEDGVRSRPCLPLGSEESACVCV